MTAPDTPDAADLAYRADPANWRVDREAFRKGYAAGRRDAAGMLDELADAIEQAVGRSTDVSRAEVGRLREWAQAIRGGAP